MNESNGIEVTIPQKQTARDDPPNQGSHCKHHAGNMCGREKHGSHNDCQRLPGQDSQETEQEIILQDELLLECPKQVPSHMQSEGRRALERVQCMEFPRNSHQDNSEHEASAGDPKEMA